MAHPPPLRSSQDKTTNQEEPVLGYIIVGDNVDMRNKARHPLKTHGNKDHHFFHILDIKKRLKLDRTGWDRREKIRKENNMPPARSFLPSTDNNLTLTNEFKTLIGKILCKNVPELEWMEELLPKHIYHPYLKQVSKTSQSVSKIPF